MSCSRHPLWLIVRILFCVLGKAYDRSPCGTGTSAKLACLYADGKLKAGEVWRQGEHYQESIFEEGVVCTLRGVVCAARGELHPLIKGSAYVNADAQLILDGRDPFQWGIRV